MFMRLLKPLEVSLSILKEEFTPEFKERFQKLLQKVSNLFPMSSEVNRCQPYTLLDIYVTSSLLLSNPFGFNEFYKLFL